MCHRGGEAVSGVEVGQETGSSFHTSFTCRVFEYSAWRLGFLCIMEATRSTVSGSATEWLIVPNCILLCTADH